MEESISIGGRVEKRVLVAVVERANGVVEKYLGDNLVTNAGLNYYAHQGAVQGGAGSYNWPVGCRLGTNNVTAPAGTDIGVNAFIAQGSVATTAAYPVHNDADADNSGRGTLVASWLFTFGTGLVDLNNVGEIAIVSSLTAAGSAISHGTIATFSKGSQDTLKFFCNHTYSAT